ncbi:hypothetical protein HDV05_001371 [Chytridiales sp. JEL 0842]|nr:hypothetical protein HDV05_001371 [Chytridiales sp. JEL 0842]
MPPSSNTPATAVLFLAAGYGTRFQRDIENDTTNSYAHLRGVPKALLPLNGIPLISHWLSILDNSKSTATLEPFIICNDSNHNQFLAWAEKHSFPQNHIYNDKTTSNENRNGAVKDIWLAVEHFGLDSPKYNGVLVVAGDTFFLRDFNLNTFLNRAARVSPASFVTYYYVSDSDTWKTGILELEASGDPSCKKVTGFLEKPGPEITSSRIACPCFYYLTTDGLRLLNTFLKERTDANATLEEMDATGKFIGWLIHKHDVYATSISGRLDIGGLPTYLEANDYFLSS